MLVLAYMVIGGILSAAAIAIIWTLFFTSVIPWPSHVMFTPLMFHIGGLIGALLGLERALR